MEGICIYLLRYLALLAQHLQPEKLTFFDIRGHSISTYAPKWLKFDPPSPLVRTRTLDTHPLLLRTYSWLFNPPPHISKRNFLDIQNQGEGHFMHSRDTKIITTDIFQEKSIILFKQNCIILEQGVSNSFGPRAT